MNTQVINEKTVQIVLGTLAGALFGYIIGELIIAGIDEEFGPLEVYEDETEREETFEEQEEYAPEDLETLMRKPKTTKKDRKRRTHELINYNGMFKPKPDLAVLANKTKSKMTNDLINPDFEVLTLEELNTMDIRNFNVIPLRYYKQNNVLVNEDTDVVLIDLLDEIGEHRLSQFGYHGHNAYELYIIHREKDTIYEITKAGSHEVYELTHEEDVPDEEYEKGKFEEDDLEDEDLDDGDDDE